MRSSLLSLVLVALYLLVAREAFAHPAPFSYLDLHLDAGGVSSAWVSGREGVSRVGRGRLWRMVRGIVH